MLKILLITMVEKRALIYIKLFVAFVKALLPAFTPNKRAAFFYSLQLFSQWNEGLIDFQPICIC
ncbi:hypothetical protein [Heyndrickxia oleronia]|uniref:hypothetical protein n=1 Tax=Heyndrickxia oleronia TaxID=38875 RepID=UPI0021B17EB9|nr:hypothetical protein [Heyndrickxia oleronia]